MTHIYIRPAAITEVLTILSEWQIATKLARPVLECLGSEHNYTLVTIDSYKLLVSTKRVKPKGTVEVHVACPRDSIVASRALSMLAMKWLLEDKNVDADTIVVFAPKGKMSNLAKRVGFTETNSFKCKGSELALTYTRG